MKIERYKGGRFWAVYDANGQLVCVTVYKRGAAEVVKRLTAKDA
jgi:YD repeat-containing protein